MVLFQHKDAREAPKPDELVLSLPLFEFRLRSQTQ